MDLACVLHTAAQETLLSTVATMIAGIFQLISRCVAVFAEGLSVDVFEDTTGDDEDNFDCANYVINLICKGGGPEEVKEGCGLVIPLYCRTAAVLSPYY